MSRTLAVRLFFCVCLFTLSSLAQAHNAISGTVTDTDHAAIPRATVRLLGPDGSELEHTLTDQQGRFSFSRSCDSGCIVEISLSGFRTQELKTPLPSQPVVLAVAPVRENIVVTANRTETPTEQTGSDVTVITHEEIAARQPVLLSDLLAAVPGSTVVRSGQPGEVTSLFMRGGESDYVKVLLDGIPINEPGGAFDFSNFTAEGVDHIEVVRGPQSALFGSDAMTGVVQIFSRHGTEEGGRPHVRLGLDGGRYSTLHGEAGVSGRLRPLDYDAFWSQFDTDNQGVNAAFRDTTAGMNVGTSLGEHTQLRWILRGDSSRAGTPGQTAFQRPDTDALLHKSDGYTGISLQNELAENWNQRLVYTFERSRQISRDLLLDPPYTPAFDGHTAPFQFFDFQADFANDTRRHHLEYQTDASFGSGKQPWGMHLFTLEASWDGERGFIGDRLSGTAPILARRNNFGGSFQYQAAIGRLFLSNGFRVEDNGSFGRSIVPRSSAAFVVRQADGAIGATKLKFNFGLGIKEPSFTESFSPDPSFLGNPDLRPERVRSFDFGIEQRIWNDRAKLEVNWFDNRFRDLIEFETTSFTPFTGTFFNLDSSRANGAEIILEAAPGAGVHLTAQYTYVNGKIIQSSTPDDPVFGQGQGLLRRPRHSGSLDVTWSGKKLLLNSALVYVGRRVDSDFDALVPPLTSGDPYTNWDLGGSYQVSRQLSYFVRVENLLDTSYMEALGFPALRIGYRTGLKFQF